MANRKRPETVPILDSVSDADKRKPTKELPKAQISKVASTIHDSSGDRVRQLKEAAAISMKRLGKRRAKGKLLGKPRGKPPANTDFQSLFRWMDNVEPGDKKAIDQIVSIHSTCSTRV